MDIEKTKISNKHVQWDQEKLKQTEKDRGKYQKIDEPKTPYRRRNSQEEIEEMQIESREGKTQEQNQIDESLKKAEKNREINRKNRIDIAALNEQIREEMKQYNLETQMKEQQTEEEKRRKEEFKKKRSQHYNEFKMIMQARVNNWEDEDQDE